MGCWDVFCIICGNTCHGPLDDLDDLILEFTDKNYTENEVAKFREYGRQMGWLSDCVILLQNNSVIEHCREESCNIEFYYKKMKYSVLIDEMNYLNEINYKSEITENIGTFLHYDCYKYLCKKVGFKIKYKDIPIFCGEYYNNVNIPKNINFGSIKKYWEQDFNFVNLYLDKNIYMSLSPLKNTKNAKRIDKIISQYKINHGRKGPSTSASFYKSGTIKIGENKNFWKKVGNKWVELKDGIFLFNVKIDKNYIKSGDKFIANINKIPQIGHFNDIPLFVNKFTRNANITSIEFIGTENTLDVLKKKFEKNLKK